ncbi:MAG TPA: EAL domain-containing protein [Thermoanaerobaculia bacterium]|nr:EAL domain-containing protein [Thermoanaerobaculia bacterium]
MNSTHSLLSRQLRQFRDLDDGVPAEWQEFVAAVDAAYRRFDEDREALERSLRHQACHDPLTGLPNRLLVRDRIELAIDRAKRRGEKVAVFLVDIDGFKTFNDILGHGVGDRLLEQVARRLARRCRANDTLGRVGADEFLFVVDNLRYPEDSGRIAEALLADLRAPFAVEGHEIHLTAGIGISLFPLDGGDPETLTRLADIALHGAKAQGRASYKLYTPDMNLRTVERLLLDNRLQQALSRNEFVLHYQPQFDARSGELTGLEALIRWRHPEGDLWLPEAFIAAAEETGVITEVGDWVLREACGQARRWEEAGYRPVRVAVNLSPRQFLRGRPVERLGEVLAETGLRPERLEVELTESTILQNPELGSEILRAFRDLGVSVAVDDFGTGYSSLSYLKRLPISTLKIDQSFVRECDRDPIDGALVSAIIGMGHSLGLLVIAEGVESEGQREFLRAQGCDQLQGYLLGYPMDAEAMSRFLPR